MKNLLNFLANESETLRFAKQVADVIQTPCTIYLYGELGAGKTTFSRGLIHGLGYAGKVKSPTYTLVEPYQTAKHLVYHFDLYRIHDPEELEHIGIRDYAAQDALLLIEWPERADSLLPKADINCYFELQDSGRKLRLQAVSKMGEGILHRLS